MNLDEMAHKYIGQLENKSGVFNEGDMETCFLAIQPLTSEESYKITRNVSFGKVAQLLLE